jgi:hypothetical protein
MMISSPLMQEAYEREVPDYTGHQQRSIVEEPDLQVIYSN